MNKLFVILFFLFISIAVIGQSLFGELEGAFKKYAHDNVLTFEIDQTMQFKNEAKENYKFEYAIFKNNLRIDGEILDFIKNENYSILINHLTQVIVLNEIINDQKPKESEGDFSFLQDYINLNIDFDNFTRTENRDYVKYSFNSPELIDLKKFKIVLHNNTKLIYSIESETMANVNPGFPNKTFMTFDNYKFDSENYDIFNIDDIVDISANNTVLKKYKSYKFINQTNEQSN